jgi:hypothetical protein
MTVNGSTPGHDDHRPRALCGGVLKQRDGTCTQAAGWGTSHPGVGACKLHGGSTPSHVAAAQKVQAEQVLRRVWNPDATPVTDSVAALQRLAGRLEQAADVIGAQLTVGEPCELCGRGGVDLEPVNAAAWIRTVRELRTALAEMERLGIASRGMEITQALAGELGSAVRRILDRFRLSEEQLLLVPVVVPEELRRIVVELPTSPVGEES